jgi:hypothetical protein
MVMSLTSAIAFGQFTTTKFADKVETPANIGYDSTSNYLGGDVKKYIGQELYLKGKAETLRKYGYSEFYIDYKNTDKIKKNIYKCCDPSGLYSNYNELEGKNFKVLDVIESKNTLGKIYFLKLQETISNDIVYFNYDAKYDQNFHFIVVGFAEKLKRQMVGQTFVFNEIKSEYNDIKTGKKINFELGKEWECFNMTLDARSYTLSLLFKDDNGQEFAIPYSSIKGEKKRYKIFTKKEADDYKIKFGQDIWNSILQGKIAIGMTKEMCILSWGKSEKINRTITAEKISEQWVYSNNYLYFEDDILKAIQ